MVSVQNLQMQWKNIRKHREKLGKLFIFLFSYIINFYSQFFSFSWKISQQTFLLMKTSWRLFEDLFSLHLQKVLKMLSRRLDQDEYVCLSHTSSEDVSKTWWSKPINSSLSYVFMTFSRRFQDLYKTSW